MVFALLIIFCVENMEVLVFMSFWGVVLARVQGTATGLTIARGIGGVEALGMGVADTAAPVIGGFSTRGRRVLLLGLGDVRTH